MNARTAAKGTARAVKTPNVISTVPAEKLLAWLAFHLSQKSAEFHGLA